jgi:hypothetical protein
MLEVCHCISKALVTTNPNLVPEHQRISCIRPLLYVLSEPKATPLMQFETLLALTNLLSVGYEEHRRFFADRGIHKAHFLIFNDDKRLRTAAAEVFCNIAAAPEFITFLRIPEHVRLWLALCESDCIDGKPTDAATTAGATASATISDEYDDDDYEDIEFNNEEYKAARAASGALAIACRDDQVSVALMNEVGGPTVCRLVKSPFPELSHRGLVLAKALLSHPLELEVTVAVSSTGDDDGEKGKGEGEGGDAVIELSADGAFSLNNDSPKDSKDSKKSSKGLEAAPTEDNKEEVPKANMSIGHALLHSGLLVAVTQAVERAKSTGEDGQVQLDLAEELLPVLSGLVGGSAKVR